MCEPCCIENLPLNFKNPINFQRLYNLDTCSVSVNYCVFDPKKRKIMDYGSSRACGQNHPRFSIHAEHKAIYFCRSYTKKQQRKYEIYIWKYMKNGKIKPYQCCHSCTKLAKKYNLQDSIYTFNDSKIESAISENPRISLAYKVLRDL